MPTRPAAGFPMRSRFREEGLNYIRNSVKIVIDAYNGTVDFYVADASDAIIETYRRIFPGLFKPFEVMPARSARSTSVTPRTSFTSRP